MESYQEEATKGKELNKDQKEALAKYSDVLGQIDCVKELAEQFKKIQTEVFFYLFFISLKKKSFFFFSQQKIKNVLQNKQPKKNVH